MPQPPPPRPESLLESPSPPIHLPTILDDILDVCDDEEVSQQPVHGGDGSTMSDQSSVHSETPHSLYLSLSPCSPSPPAPASPSSIPPIAPAPPAPPTRPQRIRRPRSEWLPEQWAVPNHYRQIREPTPAVPSSDEKDDNSDDPIDLINALSASTVEHTTYKQSQQQSDAELWHTACEEEMEAHRVNGTWEIVKLPPRKRAIGSRWFLKVKHNADGSLDRYKGRIVAKGYSQRPGFDFKETFAPTVRYSTIRTVLAITALGPPCSQMYTALCKRFRSS
jgi:hypothetical protein